MEVASRELGAGVGECCSSSQQGAVISASIPAAFPEAQSHGTAQAEPAASGNPEQARCNVHCPFSSHLFFICVRLMKMSTAPQSAAQEGVAKGATSKPHQLSSIHKNLLFAQSKVARAGNISVLSWEEICKKCQWCKGG